MVVHQIEGVRQVEMERNEPLGGVHQGLLRHSAAVKLLEQVSHQRWVLGRLRNRRFYGLAEFLPKWVQRSGVLGSARVWPIKQMREREICPSFRAAKPRSRVGSLASPSARSRIDAAA